MKGSDILRSWRLWRTRSSAVAEKTAL